MVVVFVLVRLLPGDPTSAILGIHATDATVARINAQLGLDKPIPVQFLYLPAQFLPRRSGQLDHPQVPVTSLILIGCR